MAGPGEHRITTLEDGLRVVSEPITSVRSVALAFWIDAGSVNEPASQSGYSHLLEHMLFRGTERYGSEEIDQIFDGMGSELNAGTGKDSTSVYTRVLDRHLATAVDVMSDMVWRPVFGELETEREVVLEEIAMYEDDPQELIFDIFAGAVFGEHALGRSVIGRADVVGAAQRPDLEGFHAQRYQPARIVVAAAGSVDHDELVALTRACRERGSVPAPPGQAVPAAGEALTATAPPAQRADVRFQTKPTEQFHVCVGGLGLARDDERRFALRVLDNILGGTSSSRLFQEIRERRGLAYSIFSYANQFAATGEVGVYLGTRPENLQEALTLLGSELARFASGPATAEELDRSRENVKGRTVLALESTSARMNRLGAATLAEMPILTLDEVVERIDAVTVGDLEALAAELCDPAGWSVAGIGPDPDAFTAAVGEYRSACASATVTA